jgi:hypothetical protein
MEFAPDSIILDSKTEDKMSSFNLDNEFSDCEELLEHSV